MPDKRRASKKISLTLTLSRPTGEGTARSVLPSFKSGWNQLRTNLSLSRPYLFSEVGTPRCGVPAPCRRGTGWLRACLSARCTRVETSQRDVATRSKPLNT